MLGDNSAVVEYYILNNKLLVFVVDQNSNQIKTYFDNVSRENLEEMINKLTCIISSRPYEDSKDRVDNPEVILDKLETILLDPVKDMVKESKHIHIIPHGALHNLPFHILPWEKRRLIERYTISYSPSASVLKYCRNRSNNLQKGLAIGGSPRNDLNYAEATAMKIAKILGCDFVTQNNASRKNVISMIQDKDLISFDCHAIFDENDVLESYIELPYLNSAQPNDSEKITARVFFT
jgi:CHAT domain-containing protein